MKCKHNMSICQVLNVVTTNLKFHNVTASWSTNKTGSNITIILVQGPHIPWIFIMVNDLWKKKGNKNIVDNS